MKRKMDESFENQNKKLCSKSSMEDENMDQSKDSIQDSDDVEMKVMDSISEKEVSTVNELIKLACSKMKQLDTQLLVKGGESRTKAVLHRALRSTITLRPRLEEKFINLIIKNCITDFSNAKEYLLTFFPTAYDDISKFKGFYVSKSVESHVYIHLLAMLCILDHLKIVKETGINQVVITRSVRCADSLVKHSMALNSHICGGLIARCLYYQSLVYELVLRVPKLIPFFHESLRKYTNRASPECEATVMNILLRYYTREQQYQQAYKLIKKSKFPNDCVNSLTARYLYYKGRVLAVHLEYNQAYKDLQLALRKSPQRTAIGFKQHVRRLLICVELLMGQIPDKSIFRDPEMENVLYPYYELTKAVRVGTLITFIDILKKYNRVFKKDKLFTMILRLRHNVIKIGLRRICLVYSRISLHDIAEKLAIGSEEDAEYIIAKAIRDGVIIASINPDDGSVTSKNVLDVYRTNKPASMFQQRANNCLELEKQCLT
ncbi:26S proteasome regulatory subunit RPN3, partial [Intoshia linei]